MKMDVNQPKNRQIFIFILAILSEPYQGSFEQKLTHHLTPDNGLARKIGDVTAIFNYKPNISSFTS